MTDISIPKSLGHAWSEVAKDRKITRDDYNKLVNVAAPNGKDEEISKAEYDFLSKVREEFGNDSNNIVLVKPGQAMGTMSFVGVIEPEQPNPLKIIKQSLGLPD